MRIVVQCDPTEDPDLSNAPATVVVTPRDLASEDLQQLRRVLHTLVTSAPRIVVVDLSDVCAVRRTHVVAVLVGAAREARNLGSTVRVVNAPADASRALFVAGVDGHVDLGSDGAAYEIVVGATMQAEPLAV